MSEALKEFIAAADDFKNTANMVNFKAKGQSVFDRLENVLIDQENRLAKLEGAHG